jgi:thiamine kinase-like enzyme
MKTHNINKALQLEERSTVQSIMASTDTNETASLSATDALKLISPFFPQEWALTAPTSIRITKLTNGLMNTLHHIHRTNAANSEPASLLIRHFGLEGSFKEPTGTSIDLSAAQQAVVYWEMSRRGWGPKVYGFFPGGRLEGFVEGSHTLTAQDSTREDVRRGVARAYARLNSLRLPLRKDSFVTVVRELGESAESKREDVLRTFLGVEDPTGTVKRFADVFRETDWAREFAWVAGLFEKYDCKTTITHGDTNYLNVLVKGSDNSESESDKYGCSVMLIDYETVSYSYRGFDIGGHFNERMYSYNQPDSQLTGFVAPGIDEQRSFCESYLREMQDLGGDVLPDIDTVDHLMLEASIGRLYHLLHTAAMCTVYDEVEVDPLFLTSLVHMMKTYKQLKWEFVQSHRE